MISHLDSFFCQFEHKMNLTGKGNGYWEAICYSYSYLYIPCLIEKLEMEVKNLR